MKTYQKLLCWCLLLLLAGAVRGAEISVLDGLTREFTVEPGRSIESKLVIRNNTDEPQEVRLFQTDYLFYADGRNLYGEPGSAPRSNASWITFAPHQFTLPPKETTSVPYSLQVPNDPGLTGTYWSLLMVEPVAGSLEILQAGPGKPTVTIRTVVRYGVQFVTNIQDTGKREIRFLNRQLIDQNGKLVLRLELENIGERWLNPSIWVELFSAEGASMGRFGSEQLRVYPGCSTRFDIALAQLPKGTYRALIIADNGDEYVFGLQCNLQIE